MSLRTPIRLMAIVPVACAATLLAGCGSSGGSTTNDAAASHGSGSSNSSSGSSSGGSGVLDGIGHPVNICGLMPAATAASASGVPVTVAQEQDTPSYKIWVCNYTTADGTNGFTISVLAMDAVAGYSADVQANSSVPGAKYQTISGLGDKAFTSISGVEALFGNVQISVSNLSSDSAYETLIRDIQSKL
jgi:hypothetical protein